MAQNMKNRRKKYFINKSFQRNFILKFCALVAFGAAISGVIIYLMSGATVTTTFENGRLTIKTTADFILPAVLLSSAVVMLLIGVATIIITLFTSHKIAGPLYRIEKDVEEVALGNLKIRFFLRKGDEIKALAEDLDKMVGSLRDNIANAKGALSDLESSIEAVKKEEGKDLTKDVKGKLQDIKKALSKFST